MRLAMSILVRDEADIIESNVRFHASKGVDCFIVTDNGSVDGTRDILADLQKSFDLHIIDEPSHTIDQDLWVTRMAHQLRDAKSADWVINNDADEFWYPSGGNLKLAIEKTLTEAEAVPELIGALRCKRHNMLPSHELVGRGEYRFTDNCYRVLCTWFPPETAVQWHDNGSHIMIRTVLGKVVTRLDGLNQIDMGNHGADHALAQTDTDDISIYHYPIRDYAQFEKKVVNYGQSLLNNERFAQNISRHLRHWYEQYEAERLRDEYAQLVLPEAQLQTLVEQEFLSIDPTLSARARTNGRSGTPHH